MGRRSGGARHNPAPNIDKKARALELKKQYRTYREIGVELGISTSTAQRWVVQEMRRIVSPGAFALVQMEVERYAQWNRMLIDRIVVDGQPPEKIVPLLYRGSKEFRELLGLDAAIKVEATVTETTQADMEWAEMVREAQAREAVNREQTTEQAK